MDSRNSNYAAAMKKLADKREAIKARAFGVKPKKAKKDDSKK